MFNILLTRTDINVGITTIRNAILLSLVVQQYMSSMYILEITQNIITINGRPRSIIQILICTLFNIPRNMESQTFSIEIVDYPDNFNGESGYPLM